MRVNVRKYMAPLFDRWREATVLGWRHRRGVEKLRIVSQERVCRAWFQKRQEEKRCVLGNQLITFEHKGVYIYPYWEWYKYT